MKRNVLKIVMLSAVLISLCNILICTSVGKKSVDVTLNNVEAVASGESGSNHGRPLLHPVPLNAQIVLAKIVVQHAKSKLRAN